MSTRSRLGMETVLTAVILTSTLCVIVFAASGAANDATSAEIEKAQFDQARNVMLALDKLIKRIIYKPQSSGFVKGSFWTTVPHFTNTGEDLTITLWNGTQMVSQFVFPVNIVKIKGGPRASVASDRNLVGNESLILRDVSSSLGRVREYQLAGAWVALDYSRVRCINSGVIQYYNGTGYEPYNVIEITVVNITFKDFQVQEQASFTIKNKGLDSTQEHFVSGSNLKIVVNKPSSEEILPLEQLGNPSYRTLVNLVVINIEVSLLGGA